jgi:hypothetical protein
MISRRSPFGRWLGLLGLAVILAVTIYAQFNPSLSGWQPSNDAERLGAHIGQAALLLLYLFLMFRFGFSHAARTFFAHR